MVFKQNSIMKFIMLIIIFHINHYCSAQIKTDPEVKKKNKILNLFRKKFDKEEIQSIVQDSVKLPETDRLSFILEELSKRYGTTKDPKYHFFNGGDAYGMVAVLHASLTEYLLIYGSAIPNGGHSGRYLLNIYDFVYQGKVTVVTTDNPNGQEILPGQYTFLRYGQAKHYGLNKNTWMIEYAYGLTPSALPFFVLSLFSTGDLIGFASLFYDYSKNVVYNLITGKI